MILILFVCIQGIVFVNCGNCEKEIGLLNFTAQKYTDWALQELENNNVINKTSVLPIVNANNAWRFNSVNNSVIISAPKNIDTSLYQFKVSSIEIQTAMHLGGNSCSELPILNMHDIRIQYTILEGNSEVRFNLPNMEYDLNNQDLVVKIPINTFTSSDIKITFQNIPEDRSYCLRFELFGSILNATHIIGYEITIPTSGDLPNYLLEGTVCDRAYNICSGDVRYLIDEPEDPSLQEMSNPENRLSWDCYGFESCFINIKIIFDSKLEIKMLTIKGLIKKFKTFLKVRLPSGRNCKTGESSILGNTGEYHLYNESFDIIKSTKSNIFEFDICVDSTDSVDIYSLGFYDIFMNKIKFKNSCISEAINSDSNNEAALISISIITILISVVLVIFTIVFFKKYLEQKKLISSLINEQISPKRKEMKLPLIPKTEFTDSDYYQEISDTTQLMEQKSKTKTPKRTESNIEFTENNAIYGKIIPKTDLQISPLFESTENKSDFFSNTIYRSFKTDNNQLNINREEETVYSNRNKEGKNDSFSEYNNLKHL